MLIPCPECARQVSDRAYACPGCGFPVREERAAILAEEKRKLSVATREEVGEVDCVPCQGRGLINLSEAVHGIDSFEWCPVCGHSGRVVLCHAAEGYYAVSHIQLAGFLDGSLHDGAPGVNLIGTDKPTEFRYEDRKKRYPVKKIPDWFVELMPKLPPNIPKEEPGPKVTYTYSAAPTPAAAPAATQQAETRAETRTETKAEPPPAVEMHSPMDFLANMKEAMKQKKE